MLEKLRSFLRELESTGLDTLAAIIPWVAPITTAWMVYNNVITYLRFDVWIAWVMAGVTEGLGLVTISTTYGFWVWNEREDKSVKEPTSIAALAAGFYLAVIIVVNVILEVGHTEPVLIVAKALISLLSVVAGVVLALRTRHASRLIAQAQDDTKADAEAERQRRAAELAELRRAEAEREKTEMEFLERQSERAAERDFKLDMARIKLAAAPTGQSSPASGQPVVKSGQASLSSGQAIVTTGRATGQRREASGQASLTIRDVKHFREIMAQAVNGERPTGPDDLTARFGVARTTARRWWSAHTAASAVAPASAPPDAMAH